MDCDAIVVGAGLAGLECARTLQEHGHPVRLLEAADTVGGRIRSEQVDGFTIDRGFQVLNPAYPAVRRRVDVAGLDLRPMFPGVAVRQDDRLVLLADPRRSPERLGATLTSGYVRPLELLRLAAWAAPALGPVSRLLAGHDVARGESLDRAGVTGALRHEVLDRFLAGVILEEDGSTSTAFTRLLLRSFALGTPGVPAAGMGALPRQLALEVTQLETGAPVDAVDAVAGGFRVRTAGRSVTARTVVVATDPRTAERLTGVPAPAMKGLATFWYAADEPPLDVPATVVDARRRGPVVNAAVMTAVAPSYAPPGRHLVQATCLHRGTEPDERAARRHLATLLGVPTDRWELVARSVVPDALPVQPAPLRVRRPVALGGGLFVCGDHRDTASQQGALVSGRRTGAMAAAWLSSTGG